MADRNTFLVDSPFTRHREEPCAEGTYEVGKVLGRGADDGKLKPMSGSQNLFAAGVCDEAKTVTLAESAAGAVVRFKSGYFMLSGSSTNAPDAGDQGRLMYGESSSDPATTVVETAGTNPLMGRFVGLDSQFGLTALGHPVVHIDDALHPSGSVNNT